MKRSVLVAFAAVAVLGLSSAFAGETWHMLKSNDSKTVSAPVTDYTYWKDADGNAATNADIFSIENDFYVDGGKELRTRSLSFTAHSLSVGNFQTGTSGDIMHDSGNLTVAGLEGGLILNKGYWIPNIYNKTSTNIDNIVTYTIDGMVTVNSTADDPFRFRTYQYGYKRDIFTGDFRAAADKAIKLLPYSSKYRIGYISFGFRNLSNYEGLIELADTETGLVNGRWVIGLELGSTTMPGKIKATGVGSAVKLLDGTNQVSVAQMELGGNVRLVVQSDGQTNGLITVTDEYVQNGPVVLEVWLTDAFVGGRLPVLRVPATSSLNENDFTLTNLVRSTVLRKLAAEHPELSAFCDTRDWKVVVVEDQEAGTKTLCLDNVRGTALLEANDDDNWSTSRSNGTFPSSMTNTTKWTDGKADHTNTVCHLNGHRLRTPASTGPIVFPGQWLVMDGTASYLHFCAPSFAIDYLYLTSPSVSFLVTNGTEGPGLIGKEMFISDATTLHIYNYTSSVLKFSPEIVGGGKIRTHGKKSTNSSSFGIELAGLNTNWQGTVWMAADWGDMSNTKHHPSTAYGYPKLTLSDGRNLGGRLPEFTYDALRLSDYAKLVLRNDVTLADGLNRGVFVDRAAVHDTGKNLTINQTLTMGGSFYKTGAGTLTLGGKVQFMTYEPGDANTSYLWNPDVTAVITNKYASSAVSELPDANDPSLSFLAVSSGYLKVAHVDAVNGLKVDFTPASKAKPGLKLDFNPADDDLRLYGVRNVKTDTPFAGTVNVTFDTVNEVDEDVLIMTNGVFTVKTEKYAETRAQFKVAPPKVKGCHVEEVIFTSGANGEYTTFGYEYERRGLSILVW